MRRLIRRAESAVLVVREVHAGGDPHQAEYPGQFASPAAPPPREARPGACESRAMAASCRAIPAGGSTKSATPAAMALLGMPSIFRGLHFLREGDAAARP